MLIRGLNSEWRDVYQQPTEASTLQISLQISFFSRILAYTKGAKQVLCPRQKE